MIIILKIHLIFYYQIAYVTLKNSVYGMIICILEIKILFKSD